MSDESSTSASPPPDLTILLVDDQRSTRITLRDQLQRLRSVRVDVVEADSLERARVRLREHEVDVALVDICLTDDRRNRDGLVLVRELARGGLVIPICCSSWGDMAAAREAMRSGAYDYLINTDFSGEMIEPLLRDLVERRKLEREVLRLRARSADIGDAGLIGNSLPMRRLRTQVQRVAMTDKTVLVTGPVGSGKGVVARALHRLGAHSDEPFYSVNCGGLTETLFDSTLFGVNANTVTSVAGGPGYIETVGQGTLFLDEVAEIPASRQAALLEVLETREFRRLGHNQKGPPLQFRGRVVAATHADLHARASHNEGFRRDLLSRLVQIEVRVPGLEERREDIPQLVAHLTRDARRKLRFTDESLRALMELPWPDNVRGLRNTLDRLEVFHESDTVTRASLAEVMHPRLVSTDELLHRVAREVLATQEKASRDLIESMRTAMMRVALDANDGNQTAAAAALGVHRKAVGRFVNGGSVSAPPDEESGDDP